MCTPALSPPRSSCHKKHQRCLTSGRDSPSSELASPERPSPPRSVKPDARQLARAWEEDEEEEEADTQHASPPRTPKSHRKAATPEPTSRGRELRNTPARMAHRERQLSLGARGNMGSTGGGTRERIPQAEEEQGEVPQSEREEAPHAEHSSGVAAPESQDANAEQPLAEQPLRLTNFPKVFQNGNGAHWPRTCSLPALSISSVLPLFLTALPASSVLQLCLSALSHRSHSDPLERFAGARQLTTLHQVLSRSSVSLSVDEIATRLPCDKFDKTRVKLLLEVMRSRKVVQSNLGPADAQQWQICLE